MPKITQPTPLAIARAQNTLLNGAYWPQGLETRKCYSRRHDDTDGQTNPAQDLEVTFGPDGDAWVTVAGAPPLRFRTHAGGGGSWNTRNALLLLAEAIKRDNEERPQPATARALPAPVKLWDSLKWDQAGNVNGDLTFTPEQLFSLVAHLASQPQGAAGPIPDIRSAQDVQAVLDHWIPDHSGTVTSAVMDAYGTYPECGDVETSVLAWSQPYHGQAPSVQLKGPVPPAVFFALAYWLNHPEEFEAEPD